MVSYGTKVLFTLKTFPYFRNVIFNLKDIMKRTFLLGIVILVTTLIYANNGVIIEPLRPNNTLVRVTGNEKYLLFPVQESCDDADVNVLIDGNLVRTIKVRLAMNKVDYTVPFDLTPYEGHNVVFTIITPQSRTTVRDTKEDVCWKTIGLADSFDTTNREQYRPAYHHTPLYGWMNDPNGMFYKDGVWHLYYQHNPYGSKWQNLSWGHSTSTDLIHWNHDHSEALIPNGLGLVFSGSSAVNGDEVAAIYTSCDVLSQMQSLATSHDNGETFEIYPQNPIITSEAEVRDPNFFYDNEHQQWVLVLASALEHEMVFYTSPDLKSWTYQSTFGKGIGAQGGVWECPDLFEIPIQGTDEKKWVLLCNLNPGGIFGGSATQYFVGDFDGTHFTADTDAEGNIPTKWLDFGKDVYATVSWSDAPDNRRTILGWMSNWQYAAEVPTQQYRSANTLPREISLFRHTDGQLYVVCTPSPELLALRGKPIKKNVKGNLSAKGTNYTLPVNGLCEVTVDIDATKDAILTFGNVKKEQVILTYNAKDQTLSVDRNKSGLCNFSSDFACTTTAPTFGDKLSLRIFIDKCSIEVFGNDGRFTITDLVFPTTPYTTLNIKSTGAGKYSNLNIYNIAL